MWLQLRQIKKKITEGYARKFTASFAFFAYVDTVVVLWARAYYLSFCHQRARNDKTIGSHLNLNILCIENFGKWLISNLKAFNSVNSFRRF